MTTPTIETNKIMTAERLASFPFWEFPKVASEFIDPIIMEERINAVKLVSKTIRCNVMETFLEQKKKDKKVYPRV